MSAASRRTRLLAPLVALLLATAACGDADSSTTDPTGVSAGGGLEQLEIGGKFGEEPKLEWKDSVTVDSTRTETLVEGDGETIAADDLVLTRILIANGVDQRVTSSDFDGRPQVLTVAQVGGAIKQAVTGASVGSRVAVAAPATAVFGEQGNPQLGIGNKDTVVLVLDLEERLPSEPSGAEQEPAAWVPELLESGGTPTGFDFSGAPEPGKDLRVSYLVRGDGKKAAAGDQVYVHYLGQVHGGKEPFDSSYSKGVPFDFPLGQGQVVKGWDQGLEGVPVGSRVVIAVPPALGYGKAGNSQAGIKGTDTLYFVVDLLAAI